MLDLKAESERLLAGYRLEALRLSALGMGAIVLALALGLRRARAVRAGGAARSRSACC